MALTDVKIVSALDYASGTATRNGAIIDTAGWDGVLMIVKFATIATSAVTSVYAEQGAAANLSDAAQLIHTEIAVAADDDNQMFVIDLQKPAERYVRLTVAKDGTNAAAESAVYVLYGPHGFVRQPIVSDVANALTSEAHRTPGEGTAD